MTVSYSILKDLTPAQFVDVEAIQVRLPVYLVQRAPSKGLPTEVDITFENTPSKCEVLAKVQEEIQRLMMHIPNLYSHHFKFKIIGAFSDESYL